VLDHISVPPAWRRRGLAFVVMPRSFQVLRERGMTEAALGVDAEECGPGRSGYEAMGFTPLPDVAVVRKDFTQAEAIGGG
jgi:GNAT superfamily N-acetyltransferase